jgi:predicted AAA+ superfamily ATPase
VSQNGANPFSFLAALDGAVPLHRQILARTRESELEIATHMVAASKASLLYAYSGNGKSSFINAGIIPFFVARGYAVFRTRPRPPLQTTDPSRAFKYCVANDFYLPDIASEVATRRERFLVFCDDLSFDAGDPGYKALKVMLDGTIAAPGANLLIYATSNRRHLMPDYFSENLETKHLGGEVHPGESVEEKISLSERFGLWVSFYPFSQDDYLAAVGSWLTAFGVTAAKSSREAEARTREAVQFALQRGSRSGRVALQFARDYAGRHRLDRSPSDQ